MRFNIGDTVYCGYCVWDSREVVCPDCNGDKYITIIDGHGQQFSPDCPTCGPGFKRSTGTVKEYGFMPMVRIGVITRIEYTAAKVVYWCNGSGYEDSQCAATYEEAYVMAEAKCLNQEVAQEAKKKRKVKNHKSWAWHVSYYKGIIRRAEKELQHATECLQYAKTRIKGEKDAH